MREIVRASLPLGEGRILDPCMGGGSTIAAAENVGYESVGVEIDERYYQMAVAGIPLLTTLYCGEVQVRESIRSPMTAFG